MKVLPTITTKFSSPYDHEIYHSYQTQRIEMRPNFQKLIAKTNPEIGEEQS